MNYVFAAAAIAFAAGDRVSRRLVQDRSYDAYPGIDAAQFGQRIGDLLARYDWETTQVQFNLLDSHDAPRVLSIARGDKATLRLATLLQMTYPGTPCIYYGDEIALRGTKRYDHPHRDQDCPLAIPVARRSGLGPGDAGLLSRGDRPAARASRAAVAAGSKNSTPGRDNTHFCGTTTTRRCW